MKKLVHSAISRYKLLRALAALSRNIIIHIK